MTEGNRGPHILSDCKPSGDREWVDHEPLLQDLRRDREKLLLVVLVFQPAGQCETHVPVRHFRTAGKCEELRTCRRVYRRVPLYRELPLLNTSFFHIGTVRSLHRSHPYA